MKKLHTDYIDFGFIHCGHCNKRCPFHVDQMARMEEICQYFGK